MTTIVLALSVLLGDSQLTSLQQPEGWAETTFHRIYLRNGNFIDGRVIRDNVGEVILLLKSGEMAVRRDQIDRVELIKMRSWNEKPTVLTAPKPVAPTDVNSRPNPNTPAPTVETPEAIRKKVDLMIFKLKTSAAGEKEFNIDELQQLGEEAAVYLASKLPTIDAKLIHAAGAALISLKPTPKVVEVLEPLVSNASGPVREAAATILVVTGGESARGRFIRPLFTDPDPKVRESALGLLGNVEDGDWFDSACDLSQDPVKEVRTRAMRLARTIAQKQGWMDRYLRALATQVGNPDAGVRADALAMFGGLGIKESWTHVTPALGDSESMVRAAAAQALMQLAVPESGEAIVSAMNREDDRWTRVYLAGGGPEARPHQGGRCPGQLDAGE